MSGSVIIQTPAATKPNKKRGPMRYLQVVIFLGIIAGIYLSFNGNVLSTTPGLPALVGHFTLSHVETGDTALAEIRGMYGEEISYAKAYVAHYKGESGGLTLRIGEKREVGDAEGAVNAIVASVEKGQKKDFSDLKRINVAGQNAYSLKVAGMPHYLLQSNNWVMWVDIMEGDPDQVLADVMRAYR